MEYKLNKARGKVQLERMALHFTRTRLYNVTYDSNCLNSSGLMRLRGANLLGRQLCRQVKLSTKDPVKCVNELGWKIIYQLFLVAILNFCTVLKCY